MSISEDTALLDLYNQRILYPSTAYTFIDEFEYNLKPSLKTEEVRSCLKDYLFFIDDTFVHKIVDGSYQIRCYGDVSASSSPYGEFIIIVNKVFIDDDGHQVVMSIKLLNGYLKIIFQSNLSASENFTKNCLTDINNIKSALLNPESFES